ncbi:MAG: IS1595 family transposase [Acidobacteriota bacterium]|nr:IS1595 family transposase [Acidobacteriota bacterium]
MEQQKPKMQRFTYKDFEQMFPDDASCLEWLRGYLYPEGIFCKLCQRVTKHHRTVSRPSYSCDHCGHHVHPTAGTIFHKSSTSLKTWFHAIYLMASTRCGISAKQIERETGVTYKTAWRMFKQIRTLLDEDKILSGSVEVDETYMGGKRKGQSGRPMRGDLIKTPVLGMVERKGRVIAKVIPDTTLKTLVGSVHEFVLPSSTVYTDEYASYNTLPGERQYNHRRINHSTKIYVMGDIHTNSIEGFWSLIKRGIGGVYHSVSQKFLQSYLDEYAFRYSHRHDTEPMFLTFLRQVAKTEALP